MTLEVMHPESHAMTASAPIGKGFELNTSIAQTLPSVNDHLLSLPGSQDSHHSTVSKVSGLSSSLDARSDRQLTPTSSQSGYDLSSPQQLPAYLTSPQASGSLPSYESLSSRGPVDNFSRSPTSTSRPSSYHVDSAAGHKRTASGAVKFYRAPSAESGDYNEGAQRPRTASVASRSSQLGELTAQLRARLTYAKVKVQHGWESRTLDEIETITSIPTSPASIKTHSTRALQSPRSVREQRHGESTSRPVTAPSRQLNYGQTPNGHPEPTLHASGYPIPAFGHVPPVRGSLAPPVEFSNPKRSPSGAHGIPPLITNGQYSTLSGSSSSTRSQFPSTPPMHPHPQTNQGPLHKTPSQRTMEQDAIETLLFMSSPGNSATFARPPTLLPPITAQGPAYQQSTMASSRPMLPPIMSERPVLPPLRQIPLPDVDLIPISPGRRPLEERVLAGANLHDSRGIDRVLDEMRRRAVVGGEGGDSSDEEN